MITKITINCEDEKELLAHLSVIKQQIKKEIKRQKGAISRDVTLLDSNCYGEHQVKIRAEW